MKKQKKDSNKEDRFEYRKVYQEQVKKSGKEYNKKKKKLTIDYLNDLELDDEN